MLTVITHAECPRNTFPRYWVNSFRRLCEVPVPPWVYHVREWHADLQTQLPAAVRRLSPSLWRYVRWTPLSPLLWKSLSGWFEFNPSVPWNPSVQWKQKYLMIFNESVQTYCKAEIITIIYLFDSNGVWTQYFILSRKGHYRLSHACSLGWVRKPNLVPPWAPPRMLTALPSLPVYLWILPIRPLLCLIFWVLLRQSLFVMRIPCHYFWMGIISCCLNFMMYNL
jgi:hypothetical protein